MFTLLQRFQIVYDKLIDERVIFSKYNESPIFPIADDTYYQLQLVTNLLSMSELKLLINLCQRYHLVFSVFYCPDDSDNNLSIVIEDAKH